MIFTNPIERSFVEGLFAESASLRREVRKLRQRLDDEYTKNAQLAQEVVRLNAQVSSAQYTISVAWKERDELRAKLEAAERARAAQKAFLNALRLTHDLDVPEEIWSALFSTDAGRDYVPRGEVDAAWRKGMREAINLIGLHHYKTAEQFNRDEELMDLIAQAIERGPTSAPPHLQQGQDSQHEHPPR